jgi:hypothetical protein
MRAQRALVLACAAGDGGHGFGGVGLQGLGARVVDEGDLAGAQAADQVLFADRAYNRQSVPGAAAPAPVGRVWVCQEGGRVRQDVVLAEVGVRWPAWVRCGRAGMAVAAAVGGPVVRPARLQTPPADPAPQQPRRQVPALAGRFAVAAFGADVLDRDEVFLADQRRVRGPGGDDPPVGERSALDLAVAQAGVGWVDQLVAGLAWPWRHGLGP